jgi:hypothetical protein
MDRTPDLSVRATGNAVVSQASPTSPAYHDGTDQNVRVELSPSGFRFTMSDLGCNFYCADCGVPVHHGYSPLIRRRTTARQSTSY